MAAKREAGGHRLDGLGDCWWCGSIKGLRRVEVEPGHVIRLCSVCRPEYLRRGLILSGSTFAGSSSTTWRRKPRRVE